MQMTGKSMLRLQIGPVQDFIAAARTSRDLWSGSYLLSRLMAAALHYLEHREGVEIIFPCTGELSICRWWADERADAAWVEGAEAPCLSNKLVACVPTGQAEELAQAARAAVRGTWQAIAQRVRRMLPPGIQQDSARMARYELQVQQHLAVDFAHLPMDLPVAEMQGLAQGVTQETPLTRALQQLAAGTESARYAAVYYLVDHCMNAVRKLNGFTARNAGAGRDAGWYAGREMVKDYLTGKEEQVFCLRRDAALCSGWEYARYLAPCRNDALGAITLIKRLWYVDKMQKFEHRLPQLNALYGPNVEGQEHAQNHYYAVLAMDGDNIGAALTRQNEGAGAMVDAAFHRRFSSSLAEFAQKRVGAIVKSYGGELIYAGGDDVLALLPLHVRNTEAGVSSAVDCAAELGNAFREAMQRIRPGMTVSAGLAVVHSTAPLQDAVEAARRAEGRAKSALGRNSFSISLLKRSGEIIEWGARWDSGARELLATWQQCLEEKQISAKGAHRFAELLTPYQSRQSALVSYRQHAPYGSVAAEIALLEFESMLERQWMGTSELREELRLRLRAYVAHLVAEQTGTPARQRVENPADELVPMCSVVAFMGRKPNEK